MDALHPLLSEPTNVAVSPTTSEPPRFGTDPQTLDSYGFMWAPPGSYAFPRLGERVDQVCFLIVCAWSAWGSTSPGWSITT